MMISGAETGEGDASSVRSGHLAIPAGGMQSCKSMGGARMVAAFFIGLGLLLSAPVAYAEKDKDKDKDTKSSSQAPVETRRAFLVGIQRYSDGYIQRLERAANDAKDLAKDLEE